MNIYSKVSHSAPTLNCQQGFGNKSGIYLFNLNIGFSKIKKIYMQLLKQDDFGIPYFTTGYVLGVQFCQSCEYFDMYFEQFILKYGNLCLKIVSIQAFY